MLADLQELASRKLAAVRLRVEGDIDKLQAMHVLVCRLGEQAGVPITLPTSLIAEIAKIRLDIKLADYLGAVKIAERAADASRAMKTLCGCMGSIIVILFLSSLGSVSGIVAVAAVTFVFFVFGLFGYLTFPLSANLLMKLGAASRAQQIVSAAETTWGNAITEIGKEFKRDMAPQQLALVEAEAHWQKAEESNNALKDATG
jgi:hypothetical protein